MFDNFINYLQSKITVTDEEIEMVKAVCRLKKLRRKQYLLQEGDVWRYNAFVSKGLVRTYRVDDKGQEHIFQFSPEDWWAGDRYSYLNDTPAQFNIEALEDSEIVLIAKGDYENLLEAIPAYNTFVRMLLERSFVRLQNRVYMGNSYTAEEKYNDFIKAYPDIPSRVPQHMIASYLGVSPETLSRVRNHSVKK
ncbi:Crp/Fnr family transcriptional regulator [Flavobacterium zepuense]|uniref:Crp/Fnr family transcriptional regulator n=1 Tax=Flavobacterium zepuense TaxID=2593302 RepID=A0A552V0C3_9FLAO|nr:Crp/Fnr family transcriptional regulator [Flavobacterium zepuense]TRW23931.1 Crp/Fnr family transcriptional regulator [Flavobacterium zepuense]